MDSGRIGRLGPNVGLICILGSCSPSENVIAALEVARNLFKYSRRCTPPSLTPYFLNIVLPVVDLAKSTRRNSQTLRSACTTVKYCIDGYTWRYMAGSG